MSTKSIPRIKIQTQEILPALENEKPVFHRQNLWDWWNQDLLGMSKVGGIGAGGLGGNAYRALLRAGLGHMVFADADIVELSNLNRQIFYQEDRFANKALSLAKNLEKEAVGTSIIEAYSLCFEDTINQYPDAFRNVDVALVLVDNDETRHNACRYFFEREISTIFSAVSETGDQGYVFLQEPHYACFNCINPIRKEPFDEGKFGHNRRHVCADPSSIYAHQTLTGIVVYVTILKIMYQDVPWHWRDMFLQEEDRAFTPKRREDCEVCGGR